MGFRIFKNRDDARKTRILFQCLQAVWVCSPVRHDQAANDFRLGFVSLPKLQGIELPSRTPKRFGLIRNLGNLGNRSGIYRIPATTTFIDPLYGRTGLRIADPQSQWIIAWCFKNYFLGFKRWVTLAFEALSAHGGSCDIPVIRSVDAGRTA